MRSAAGALSAARAETATPTAVGNDGEATGPGRLGRGGTVETGQISGSAQESNLPETASAASRRF